MLWKCRKCHDTNEINEDCTCGNKGILARMNAMEKFGVLTVKDIKESIASIRESKDDSERAHLMEDELLIETLVSIVNGAENPRTLARNALKVLMVGYTKYYA